MAERKVAWKPRNENTLIGKRHSRTDAIEKASGAAKFTVDINPKGTLYGRLLTCTHAHATVKSLDTSKAEAIPGVRAVHVFNGEGKTVRWDGTLIAAVAADRPEIAEDGIRAIKIEYEVLEHLVDEEDLKAAQKKHDKDKAKLIASFPAGIQKALKIPEDDRDDATAEKLEPFEKQIGDAASIKPLGDNQKGDVAAALKKAKVVHKGYYGIRTISHMCMEPHGSHCQWGADGSLDVHLSTQNVSKTAGQFAGPLGIDVASISLTCNYIGGGFGSKFAVDEWGVAAAILSKKAGLPVQLMLDRPTELKAAGTRPSGFAEVTIAADADGNIIAWDSHYWGTNGTKGGNLSLGQYPYVFDFDNRNRRATGIVTNCGPTRAWRAPPHPQLCALTDPAIDDIAIKLGKDSYDVFMTNLDKTPRPDVYAAEMKIGAKLIGWKKNWHPAGKGGRGAVKRGLGMALHQWGGRAHAALCTVKVHPDGTVESFGGTQDIGTGTRTIIAITLAETFGLQIADIKVNVGSNKYPQSGPSGGSTTVGGVSGPNRRAGLEALWKILDLVAAKYKVDADSLEAKGGKIVSGNKTICSWKQACSLFGPNSLEIQGKGPLKDGLTDDKVGGIQMADVSVDTETGVVSINKLVAVQDCGLILDLLTAESQVWGGVAMGIAYSLSEERVMDKKTGRYLNADLENYKLPKIGDVGDIVVEMYQPDDEYERGVIGLGEPPVIATGAAISNAVANATGVRVPVLPMTPQTVLAALKGGRA